MLVHQKRELAGVALLLATVALIIVACTETTPSPTPQPTATSSPAPPVSTPSATPVPTSTVRAATPTPAPSPTPTQAPPAPPTPTAPPSATAQAPTSTPISGRPVEGAYSLVRVIESANFDEMLAFSMIPGSADEAVILTQYGEIWLVSLTGRFPPGVFGDLSGHLISFPGLEEGLLGLAFSPNFGQDGRVYIYYTAGDPRRNVLSRFNVADGTLDLDSEHILLEFRKVFGNHNGGQLAFGPDGYLYVAVGDGGGAGDPSRNGQNLSTLFGKILRLDVSGEDYTSPRDNPFVNREGARPEIYAYGLRNPWRFSFDRATGEIWTGDVGQNRWEEVDHIIAGGNYGWSVMEGPECFREPNCDVTGLQMPRAAYRTDGGRSIIGGYVYRGRSMPELNGWFVYGDFYSGVIWAVNTADDSPPVVLAQTELPIASFGELPNGELIALTYANAVYQLQRSR